jgi:signal transduction histidine kinase/ActR/RegA family two-component response regulator
MAGQNQRQGQVQAEQTRLLYSNAGTGTLVTSIAIPLVGYFQWQHGHHPAVTIWIGASLLVAMGRLALARSYWGAAPGDAQSGRWRTLFALGAAVGGLCWGAASIMLSPDAQLLHQVLLVFVLGGMMLGGASLLAPRPEAFLGFLLPTGLLPALPLFLEGGAEHLAMGLLIVVFTLALIATTWRFHCTIRSSLNLRFENQTLVEDLQRAKGDADTLNRQLEERVRERTAELHASAERLRAEVKQREQMEDELLRTRKLESLGLLAGGIAHDFNNFLTVIQASIHLAEIQLPPEAPVRAILERTASASRRAAFLASQLLTFAKGGDPIRRVVPLSRLVTDAVDLARSGDAVTIVVSIADDLWTAEVDAGQIAQVLHNVLLNAKQAMLTGGVIEVRAENVVTQIERQPASIACVRISIRDYGCGIPAHILPLIFDPYFTTKRSGSGLGLATSQSIVSKHGGRIGAESKQGHGSTFIIDLPASQALAPEPPVNVQLHRGTGRLLVMDDEESLRTLMVAVLVTLGYEVLSARDGAQAVDLFEAAYASRRAFDAVLLDLTVSGGMGGVETAHRLREIDPLARIIASSGYSDGPVMSHYREHGFDAVLPKPWATVQLSEVFRRVLADETEEETLPGSDL